MKKTIVLSTIMALGVVMTPGAFSQEGLLFGYCGDYSSSMGAINANTKQVGAAIEIPAEQAQQWAGNQVISMNIGYGYSSVNEVTIFVTEDLNGEPVYTQEATIPVMGGWNTITLDTPYNITDKGFFVGYTTKVNTMEDSPIGIDDIKSSEPYGAWADLYGTWQGIGRFYGNVCVKISVAGDNLPQYDIAAVDLKIAPIVEAGKPFTAYLNIRNNGVKAITEATVSGKLNGVQLSNLTASVPAGILSGYEGEIEVAGLVMDNTGTGNELEIELLTVNGNEDETPFDNLAAATFSCAQETFKRNVVVEEFTGTWCGNCPAGIVAMAYMRENYGADGFIGIAGHYGDEMQVTSYAPVVEKFGVNGYNEVALPSCVINRAIQTYPATENIEYYYLQEARFPVGAGVTVKADYDTDGKFFEINSESRFSFDEDNATYALAYVVIQDGVGPYTQTNYFSGGNFGGLEGWNELPAKVEMYFNEVVREIRTAFGIIGSIPGSVTALTTYPHTTVMDMSGVDDFDVSQCEVVALLINTKTMEVVNAAKAHPSIDGAGVEGIEMSSEPEIYRVFNVQGVKVLETKDASLINSLEPGIYIVNGKKVKL